MKKKVQVLAVVSFENVRKGDLGTVDRTPRIEGLLKIGYLREVEDVGTLPHRPGTDQSGESGGSEAGTGGGVSAGDEQGKASDSS